MSNLTMNEGRILRKKLKLYGYEKGRTPMEFSDSMLAVVLGLMKMPEINNFNEYKSCLKEVIEMSKSVLTKYFDLHDILYLPCNRLYEVFSDFHVDTSGSISATMLDELLMKVDDETTLISPFDLPVTLLNGMHSMIGNIKKNAIIMSDDSFLEKCPITFFEVELGDEMSLASAATYSHEVIHSQIESVKGACKNYHNKEVLSIFTEKLVALDLDPSGKLLKKCEQARSRFLYETLLKLKNPQLYDRTSLVEASVYVTSIVQADHLFDKYINGDIDSQTRIIDGMQKVFDGESTVEDLLSQNSVSLQNSMSPMLIKRRS